MPCLLSWILTILYKGSLRLTCREALQALVSPTDAQLALCSAGAYGEKEGEGALRDVLPAQIELEKLSKRWNVPTGCICHPHANCHCCVKSGLRFEVLLPYGHISDML